MKELQKLQFKPGINRENTNYASEGSWWDCDKVRFRNGMPETIGGWVKHSPAQFLGTCRRMLNWQTISGIDLMGLATSKKVYIEYGALFFDITPIRSSVTKTDPITTGLAGSSIVTVTTTAAHGAAAGDYVTISGCATVDGISAGAINVEHEILTVPSTTTFTIDVEEPATVGGITGGGVSVTIAFQISIGADVGAAGFGWGTSTWGRGTWGSESLIAAASSNQIRLWSLANYGEDFVMAMRGGQIYYWDASGGVSTRGVLLSSLGGAADVPTKVGTVLVTQDRHMIALGATTGGTSNFDPLLIRWSNQEEVMNWTPSITNTSGDFRLTNGSYIVTGIQTRDETLVFTDVSLHSMRFTNPPYIFSITQIGDNVSIAGPNAVAVANNTAFWMGRDKFYVYDGVAQQLPCSVRRYVFSDINASQGTQIHAGVNEKFSEIWWFYCSANSTMVDRYVAFNYLEHTWQYGTLARSAWTNASIRGAPFATWDGYLYAHETGVDDGSTNPQTAISAHIESADFDIGDGTMFYFIERAIPDLTFEGSETASPSATLTLKTRDFPGQGYGSSNSRVTTRTVSAPVEQYTNEVWVRLRGRHAVFRMESSDVGVKWQLGVPRIGVRTDGRR